MLCEMLVVDDNKRQELSTDALPRSKGCCTASEAMARPRRF